VTHGPVGSCSARRTRSRAVPSIGMLVLVLSLAGSACAPAPRQTGWPAERELAAQLARTAAALASLDDLVAEARVTVWTDGVPQRALAVLQLKLPDLLLLEVRGPFYNHLLTAVLLGDSTFVHGPLAGGDWRGADSRLLELLTGLDLRGYDLRLALLGLLQPAAVEGGTSVSGRHGEWALFRLAAPAGQVRRAWLDRRRGLVRREQVAAADASWSLDRRLDRYRRVGPLLLPRRVELRQGRVRVRLDYQRYWVNRGLDAQRFIDAARRTRTQSLD